LKAKIPAACWLFAPPRPVAAAGAFLLVVCVMFVLHMLVNHRFSQKPARVPGDESGGGFLLYGIVLANLHFGIAD